jgi:hypothetical protein
MRNARIFGLLVCLITPSEAFAWGDNGHKTVALIAQQCLPPPVKKQITAMLAADTDPLTKHDFASAATWADKYRESNHRKDHYKHTQNWHYVDMEIDHPDLNAACFGRPVLPAGVLATDGPDKVCAIDKIKQFEAELTASSTDAEERLMALKFILHFVGDIHQPLHSSDNHDRGGNSVKVRHASSLGHGIDLYVAWVRAGAEVLSLPSACFFGGGDVQKRAAISHGLL